METNTKTINFELTKEDLANVRIPNARDDTIHKDECCYCFDTPESGTPGNAEDGGLLICLHDFLCFCPQHAHLHWEKTHHHLYLHTRTLRFLKTPENEKKEGDAAETKPTVLGIGVPGGFPTEDSKYRVEEKYALVKIPLGDRLPLDVTPPEYAITAAANNPDYDIPEVIRTAIASILKARSSEAKDELAEWKATEDAAAGPLPVSKFAESLKQEPCGEHQQRGQDGKWHCEHPGCTFTDNLWFNLGDGSVLCGRANFIGLGNNHALQHYKENPCGDRSLVVKVGTITPTEAEVYSYSEDDMVRDPLLAQHLAHFGIDRAKLTKTGRTMDELTLDVNSKYEFSRIAANEKGAKPAFGPGHTGILNLGNSCYLASVMQAIFSNEAFVNTFGTPAAAERIFREGPVDPTNDLRCQLAKLGTGLISGKYAVPTPLAVGEKEEEGEGEGNDRAQVGIRPRSFKSLIGRIDPTFASKAQQDASEFFISFLRAVERSQRESGGNGVGEVPLCEQYTTNVEERLECGETHRVRYSWRSERVIPLAIPLELATNKLEVATTEALTATGFNVNNVEPPRLNVPFDAVLKCAFGTPEYIDGFRSPATGNITQAIKTVRFATFPEHLVLMLTRHVFDENFQPKKINASVPVPDVIDLDAYRGLGGLQEGEEYLATLVKAPPPAQAPKRAEVKPNEAVVAALLDMGFPAVTAKFAALSTGNNDVEAAAAWLFEHIEDAITQDDLDALLARLNGNGDAVGAPKFGPCEIAMITSMGFTEKHAALALKSTDGNVERAIDWVLSRLDDLDRLVLADEQKQQEKKNEGGEERSEGEKKEDDDDKDDEVNLAPPPAKFPKNTASSKYELYGIIPHIGKTTNSGHYVAYVKKDGKWISFNDSKVAFVDEPPRDMGFLYFFKRI